MAAEVSTGAPVHFYPFNVHAWGSRSGGYDLGWPGGTTVGQVFRIPPGFNRLDGVRFWWQCLDYRVRGSGSTGFRLTNERPEVQAHLYAWDHDTRRATGAALWSSAPFEAPARGGGAASLELEVGGVAVTPGARYVLLLTVRPFAVQYPFPASSEVGEPNLPERLTFVQLAHVGATYADVGFPKRYPAEGFATAAARWAAQDAYRVYGAPRLREPYAGRGDRVFVESETAWTDAAWRRSPISYAFEADLSLA